MEEENYVRRFGALYNEVLSLRKNDDYTVNEPQLQRLIEVFGFFMDEAAELDGNVEPLELSPKEEHGGVTATFEVFDIYAEKVQKFCDVMRYCSAITIDTFDDGFHDGVCISCTIPDVFVRK